MASHAPQSILFVTNNGSIMTSGYSSRLGKGQFGIVDKGVAPSALGNAVTNVLPTSPKDRLFELRLGAPNLEVNRSQSNKSWSSMPFKLSEVVDISVAAPTLGGSVDDFIIGYDGINDASAIVLANGDNEVIDITLSGEAIGMLGYADAKVTVKLYLEAPNEGAFTMHEIIENAVKVFKNITLVGGVPITNYIDILPVNSENPVAVTGLDQALFTLTIFDEGNQSALGLVQASYPLYEVKRKSYDAGQSTYVLIAAVGATIADFVQTSVTLADDDCDGEPEVTTATVTTEWIEGDACTAILEDYTLQLADNKCGEDRLTELQAYYPDLTIAIDSATQVQTVNLTGTSGTANVIVNGVNYLATFATDLATTEGNFVTAHAAAILAATGATVTYAGGLITFTAPSGAMPTLAVENVTTDLAGTVSAITQTGTTVTGIACQTV